MSYPSNILDLMIVCWSQQPSDRPSASQIVSMCSAPEFAHLLDVVSMHDSDAGIIAGDAFIVEEESDAEPVDAGSFEGEIWLSRSDGTVSVLSCNQYGWLDYKVRKFVTICHLAILLCLRVSMSMRTRSSQLCVWWKKQSG